MNKAIEVGSLSKLYRGGVRALDDVSFDVEEGEIFGCLGRNGAGKTTLVRILTTLTAKTSGRALVGGRDIDAEAAEVRHRVGVALQESALDDLMTGREHLLLVAQLGGLPRRESRKRTDELLEALGLARPADRLVATYSGGIRRRLDVAMALVHRPPILFLDEPTTGLDPQSRRALWEMIQDLRAGGATVFLTTQYLEEADELADRVAILHAGRLVAVDTPDELKAGMGQTLVTLSSQQLHRLQHFIESFGPARVVRLTGNLLQLEVPGDGRRLIELLRKLGETEIQIDRLLVSEPTLEDLFVRLTGDRLDASASSQANGLPAARRLLGIPAGGGGRQQA